MPRLAWSMLVASLVVAACHWPDEPEPPLIVPPDAGARTTAMQNHQVAVHRARDAIIAQDLDGVRRSGQLLAADREVPLLPGPAMGLLEHVRSRGSKLAEVNDLDEAAEQVVEITVTCAQCHTILEIPPKVPLQATKRDLLWTALVFRSEAHWREGAGRDPLLAELRYWEDRRLALVLRMQGGEF